MLFSRVDAQDEVRFGGCRLPQKSGLLNQGSHLFVYGFAFLTASAFLSFPPCSLLVVCWQIYVVPFCYLLSACRFLCLLVSFFRFDGRQPISPFSQWLETEQDTSVVVEAALPLNSKPKVLNRDY